MPRKGGGRKERANSAQMRFWISAESARHDDRVQRSVRRVLPSQRLDRIVVLWFSTGKGAEWWMNIQRHRIAVRKIVLFSKTTFARLLFRDEVGRRIRKIVPILEKVGCLCRHTGSRKFTRGHA